MNRSWMNRSAEDLLSLITGVGVGTLLTYLLDPDQGETRRGRIADSVRSGGRSAARQAERMTSRVGDTGHDWYDTGRGWYQAGRGWLTSHADDAGEAAGKARHTAGRWVDRMSQAWPTVAGTDLGRTARRARRRMPSVASLRRRLSSYDAGEYLGDDAQHLFDRRHVGGFSDHDADRYLSYLPGRRSDRQDHENAAIGTALAVVTLVGLGVGAAYLLDTGHTRSARKRFGGRLRHLAHQAKGVAAEAASQWQGGGESPDDRTLRERLRSEAGHVIGGLDAIETRVADGVVTLRGSLPQDQIDALVRLAEGVSGVRRVQNDLSPIG